MGSLSGTPALLGSPAFWPSSSKVGDARFLCTTVIREAWDVYSTLKTRAPMTGAITRMDAVIIVTRPSRMPVSLLR